MRDYVDIISVYVMAKVYNETKVLICTKQGIKRIFIAAYLLCCVCCTEKLMKILSPLFLFGRQNQFLLYISNEIKRLLSDFSAREK